MKQLRVYLLIALGILVLSGSVSMGSSMQLTGAGLIGKPISGKTIDSPSDVGFAVSTAGGTFVCSMAGPLTGGFKGFTVMTVEGLVTKGSLKVRGSTASFSGTATVVLVPGMSKEPVQVLSSVPFTATVGLGGPGKGWLILKVPPFTKALGGDTGGVLKLGNFGLGK